jgi:hypothetical protein
MNLEEGGGVKEGTSVSSEGKVAGLPEPRLSDPGGDGAPDRGKAVDALGNMMEDWLVRVCFVRVCAPRGEGRMKGCLDALLGT